jgi:hypothetical protein
LNIYFNENNGYLPMHPGTVGPWLWDLPVATRDAIVRPAPKGTSSTVLRARYRTQTNCGVSAATALAATSGSWKG